MTATEGHFTMPVAHGVTWIKLSVTLTSLGLIHRYPLVSSTINLAQPDSSSSLCPLPPIKAVTNKPSFKDREGKADKTLHTETTEQHNFIHDGTQVSHSIISALERSP